MRIALVHDYIKEYGGAERVLEELHKLFPEAPIFTSIYAPEYLGPHQWVFRQMSAKGGSAFGGQIKTSFLQWIPYKEKLISIFRLISPLAFLSFDLSKFDVIIVSQTGAYFPNFVRKAKNPPRSNSGQAKLITYTHTPPRYLYGYMTAREWQKDTLMRIFGSIANHFLRMVDFKASENVDYFIANSEEVAARIKKFYRRDATVINPPVSTSAFSTAVSLRSQPGSLASASVRPSEVRRNRGVKKKDYYLAGGRLARAKGIDIIVEAFNRNGKRLKIFGKGFAGFDEDVHSIAKKNIEFVGEVTDIERQELMGNAKAYVFASFDEDFGITPVEAMAAGTPVIAYRSGGVNETVIDGKTGIFFDENTPEVINEGIKKFESLKISSDVCRKQAQKFSAERFDKGIKRFVEKLAITERAEQSTETLR